MEWLSNGALPMGFVFMSFTIFSVLRRKAGHVLAARDYPALAARLGLTHRASPYKTGVGSLAGELGGLRVIVDPDDQRWIAVRYGDAHRPRIEVHTYEHNKRVPSGLRSFRVTDKKLMGWFKTSYGAAEEIQVLEALGPVLGPLRSIRQLKSFSITSSGCTVVFDYGSPPFIPVAIVQEVVPALVQAARALAEAAKPESEAESEPESEAESEPESDPEGSDGENANDFID